MLEKILKQYGIEKVSARTRISRKHLSKLLQKDFEGFSKPQAYGFVPILKREYGDDFEELRVELETWFAEGEGEEKKEEIFVSADTQESKSNLKKGIAAAVVLLLAALAFYVVQNQSPSERTVQTERATPAPAGEGAERNESESVTAAPAVESAETAKPDEKEAAAPEATAATAVETPEPQPYVPMENAVITPIIKLWFGIIDLETKKRIAKTTADPYEIESKGKKLLITGHGRFEISDAFGNLFKFNDAKKHYFLIDDGMVKEIPESEFRRLNGGKVW
ncbi:hypothetical protein [Hydrogenimonas sp.]